MVQDKDTNISESCGGVGGGKGDQGARQGGGMFRPCPCACRRRGGGINATHKRFISHTPSEYFLTATHPIASPVRGREQRRRKEEECVCCCLCAR